MNSLIKNNDRILVAFSGGPDSVFLVKKLLELKNKINFEFSICYINHKLRDEAYLEEEWVKNFSKKYNLKYYIVRVDVLDFSKKKKISIETAGRILRYRILNKISRRDNYNKIATAHHLNDALETFLFNSIRGSGIFGLVLKPKYKNIIRPLILYSKEEILSFLSKDEYLIDKTNFQSEFSRNFIRNEIVSRIKEKFPSYIKGFRKTYLNLLELTNYYRKKFKKLFRVSLIYKDSNIKIFKRESFSSLKSYELKMFFSKIVKEPSFEHLERILKIMKNEGKINISRNYFFEVRGNFVGIYKKKLNFDYLFYIYPKNEIIYIKEYNMKIIVSVSNKPKIGKFIINFNLKNIFSPIIIRKRKKGDKISNKKLKEIFINYKIPNFIKDFIPVVQKDGKLYSPIKGYFESGEKFLIIEFQCPIFNEIKV
ncbi:MAG: tRNA lysidine(34) synthetase TilS [candidate division WOR-3 bacterium]